MLKKLSLISIACFASASFNAIAAPKNVIYMIGDGMGPAYLAAYRYYMDNPDTKVVERTIFDELWIGNASTYPDDDTVVTDSAAAATALSSTHKTYNGAIAVDHAHKPLTTMMEIAKAKGMQTGVVVTAQINHATPAGFLAHDTSRRNYDQIADDYFDNKINGQFVADLMLGGGTSYFIRKDRNLVDEFKQAGYQYTDSWAGLASLNKLPALGLFAPKGFVSALDNPQPLPLKQMTEKALELLTPAEKGFVVMIEGSQIDWCGHANDVACAMAEMHDFGNAIKAAKAFVDAHPDTLLVITADHETGGLSLGANGLYAWNRDVIKAVKQTGPVLAKSLVKAKAAEQQQVWLAQTGLKLTDSEWQALSKQINQLAPKYFAKDWSKEADVLEAEADLLEPLAMQAKQLIDQYSNTGWTSGAHTAIDVPVLAYGKDAQQFAGFQDNTAIASKLLNFIEKK